MKALVVYESMYGNTHAVAEAIASGLAPAFSASVVPVDRADPEALRGIDLLVVGGPTHVHGMSRESTRKAALAAATKPEADLDIDVDAEGPGLREWFDGLELDVTSAAAFDTRMHGLPVFTGRASRGIAKRLKAHGSTLVVEPESFLVTKENELDPGEVEHARAWGERLAAAVGRAAAAS